MQRLMRQCAQLEIESSNITDGGHSLGQGDALVMIQHGAVWMQCENWQHLLRQIRQGFVSAYRFTGLHY